MQIFLKCLPVEDGSGEKEWAIIELQGDLGSREDASLDGQFVGDLFYTKEGRPVMIIGHHVLFGTVQKLEKPMAILEKVADNPGSHGPTTTEFKINAIIKRKLSFRERPRPIVGIGTQTN